jgi:hypothetical protein
MEECVLTFPCSECPRVRMGSSFMKMFSSVPSFPASTSCPQPDLYTPLTAPVSADGHHGCISNRLTEWLTRRLNWVNESLASRVANLINCWQIYWMTGWIPGWQTGKLNEQLLDERMNEWPSNRLVVWKTTWTKKWVSERQSYELMEWLTESLINWATVHGCMRVSLSYAWLAQIT